MINSPWLLCGDFNVITDPTENLGGNCSVTKFQSKLYVNKLTKLGQ